MSRTRKPTVVHDAPDTDTTDGTRTTCCARLLADLPSTETTSADHSEVTCVGAE